MVAIKNWFLDKNELRWLRGRELTIIKETNKAVLVQVWIGFNEYTEWIPKSCLIDDWEKDTSNFGYHDYLVDIYNEAVRDGRIENHTFTSGRNVYDDTSFTHQMKTKELVEYLEKINIDFMTREEWNNREA